MTCSCILHGKKAKEHMPALKIPVGRSKLSLLTSLSLFGLILLLLSACADSTATNGATPTIASTGRSQPGDFGLAALPGYQVSLFARQPSGISGPDSLVVDNGFVYIDYQNVTAKDCTDKNSSTVVQYDMNGKMLKTFTVAGHSDGMRADPSTH